MYVIWHSIVKKRIKGKLFGVSQTCAISRWAECRRKWIGLSRKPYSAPTALHHCAFNINTRLCLLHGPALVRHCVASQLPRMNISQRDTTACLQCLPIGTVFYNKLGSVCSLFREEKQKKRGVLGRGVGQKILRAQSAVLRILEALR